MSCESFLTKRGSEAAMKASQGKQSIYYRFLFQTDFDFIEFADQKNIKPDLRKDVLTCSMLLRSFRNFQIENGRAYIIFA